MSLDRHLCDTVVAAVDRLAPELVDALSSAVRIESVNPKYPGQVYDEVVGGEGEVSKFMAGIYGGLGAEVDLFAVEPGRENAVGVVKGSGGGRSLIYNGHVDVVPPGDPANWKSGSPFSGKVDGDRVWGRGSTDMKSGILAQAFAARALADAGVRLQGDLILESVVGEEVMDHECGVTATVKRGYTADAGVVSEPSSPPVPLAIVPVSPGLLWFSVTVPGKASHAAMRAHTFRAGGLGAEVAVNADRQGRRHLPRHPQARGRVGPDQASSALSARALHDPSGRGHRRPEGRARSVLHSEFMTIEYCCWYHPDDDPKDVKGEIEEHVTRAAQLDPWLRANPPVIEWKLDWPPFSVDPEHPICTAIGDAHEAAAAGTRFAGRPEIHGFAAVEDVSFLNIGGVPAVSYGPGDLRVAHADDEYVLIDELVTATKTYALLAMEWCGVA